MTLVQVPRVAGVVLWAADCEACGARYAVLHADAPEAPHPRLCVFCGYRAVFHKDMRPAGDD